MATPPKYLVWIDLETTGSNPQEDPILEYAHIVTDWEAPWDTVHHEMSAVVRPTVYGWETRMPEVVLQMHTANGLLDDVSDGGRSCVDVEQEAVAALSALGERYDFMIAGSGVSHFDRAVIAHQMPKLHRFLRYNTHDVGVVRRFLESTGHEDVTAAALGGDGKNHRAMDDIEGHLEEAQCYWTWLKMLAAAAKPPLTPRLPDDGVARAD